ncbi:MAG: gluconate 2-dehydrogenase gamma chain [Thermoleophilaceae bacterium]|nr:gluconate 2-dehydrogenase gamma chain [Thermoleophilaceae bacterium]
MSEALLFLNRAEAATVEALACRIMPGDEADPGAREAGVVTYIDRGLAGFFRDQQGFYRQALRELDRHCEERHGRRFSELDIGEQDDVVGELDGLAQADVGGSLLGRLFALVREHTVQGMFCDPAYGGNRDGVGWRLVGFPGAQWGYRVEQMRPGFDATAIPLSTLADLRERAERDADG